MKENLLGRICNTNGEKRNAYRLWEVKLDARNHLKVQDECVCVCVCVCV
jgi:hypothetical protein